MIAALAEQLQRRYGRGFSEKTLRRMVPDAPVEGEQRAGRGRWAEHVEEAQAVALGGAAAAT